MDQSRTLARSLGFTDLVLITIGTVIGSGIFLVPARCCGRPAALGLAMLVWLAAASSRCSAR